MLCLAYLPLKNVLLKNAGKLFDEVTYVNV